MHPTSLRRRRLPLLSLTLCLAGAARAQPADTDAIAPRSTPAADTSKTTDPFAQAQSEQARSRWLLLYGCLFALATGVLVWRQER